MREGRPRHIAGLFKWHVRGSEALCGGSLRVEVLAEYLPRRLADLRLEEPRALEVLLDCLDGFMAIYRLTSLVSKVDPAMIALTQDDQVKVWINPNFGELRPFLPFQQVRTPAEVENELFQNLLAVVQEKLLTGKFSEGLLAFLKESLPAPVSERQAVKAITKWLREPRPAPVTLPPEIRTPLSKHVSFNLPPTPDSKKPFKGI